MVYCCFIELFTGMSDFM